MDRFSLMTIMLSIKKLLEGGDSDRALELVNEVISEIRMKELLSTLNKQGTED